MSRFDSNAEKQVKSGLYLDKLRGDCLYALFVSRKCKYCDEFQKKMSEFAELQQIINVMEIEQLIQDGETLPRYVQGVPTLIVQHRQTGQVMEPIIGNQVFDWMKSLIKPQASNPGNAAASGVVSAAEGGGVSIGAARQVRFNPSKMDGSRNNDPSQFQEPIDTGKNNDDINAKLAALASEVKEAWSRK